MTAITNEERLRRWRLVLGRAEPGAGAGAAGSDQALDGTGGLAGDDLRMDQVLEALYNSDRSASLGSSCPNVNRWLGDIRTYFPKSVVQVMQQDALQRLNLQQMLFEPETLESIEADIHLLGTLLTLKNVIPDRTKETARHVVRKVVEELERRLRNPLVQAVRGALNKASRTSRPKSGEIDWARTIQKNLKNYIPEKRTIIAERLVGYGRKRSSLRDIILCVDQSGSMASSVVYSSICGAVLASLRAVSTRLVVFDTSVVDLTEHLQDPVDVLFGTQLGGGTDINGAVGYCQTLIKRPNETIFVLISDLIEGGVAEQLLRRTAEIVQSGVTMVCLLALSDQGAPCYDERLAAQMSALASPAFACTPELFPSLMAAAIQKRDLNEWAARNEIVSQRPAAEQ
jgi:Mg-chelatase subunit ChlD